MLDFFKNIFGATPGRLSGAASVSAALVELDLELAIATHQNLRRRLQACLDGNSSELFCAVDMHRDDLCELGLWIHGPGKARLGRYPAFTALMGHHKMFHYTASNLLMLAKTDQDALTRQRRMEQLDRFSRAVVQDLENLRPASLPDPTLRRTHE